MKTGREKVAMKLTPIEFTGLVQNKYELAQRITQHRVRLLASLPDKLKNKKCRVHFSSQNIYPRSYTMQYLAQQPSMLSVVGRVALGTAVIAVLARKIGYKKLWRWGGIAMPIVWPWLKRKL